jgi:hypothetical protein
MQHAVQRHRDNLDDYRRDFLRTRSNVEQAVQRHNLLGSVRKDIRLALLEIALRTEMLTDKATTNHRFQLRRIRYLQIVAG